MNYADNNNNIKLFSTCSNQYFTCQHVQNILEKRLTSEKKLQESIFVMKEVSLEQFC